MKTISIEDAFKKNLQNEEFLLTKMNSEKEAPFYIASLKPINRLNGVYFLFEKKDVNLAKNEFYKAGMTNVYDYEKLESEVFGAMDEFTYPLLSDCPQLIDKYLSFERMAFPDSFSACLGKAIQSVLKNDDDALRLNLEGLKKWSKKGWMKNYSGIVTVFDGFLTGNKAEIETGISELVAMHNKQDQPPITGDYINLEAGTSFIKQFLFDEIVYDYSCGDEWHA